MRTVYLAGPISGLTHDECTDWRGKFRRLLIQGISILSPMRGKSDLRGVGTIDGCYEDTLLSNTSAVMARDFGDCSNCDIIVANLLGAKTPSFGTTMEIAWGFALRTPVVLVMEPEGNLHAHPMIEYAAGYRVGTLEEAAYVVNSILGPYVGGPPVIPDVGQTRPPTPC